MSYAILYFVTEGAELYFLRMIVPMAKSSEGSRLLAANSDVGFLP